MDSSSREEDPSPRRRARDDGRPASDAPPLHIRPARPDDAGAIAAVQVATWKTSYRGVVADAFLDAMTVDELRAYWRGFAERGWGLAFVAENESGAIVGFAMGGPNRRAEPYAVSYATELYSIYLLPEYQRIGLGTRLMRMLVAILLDCGERSMVVMTFEGIAACGFYQRLGARVLGGEEVELGGERYRGVAYGWENLEDLASRLGLQAMT